MNYFKKERTELEVKLVKTTSLVRCKKSVPVYVNPGLIDTELSSAYSLARNEKKTRRFISKAVNSQTVENLRTMSDSILNEVDLLPYKKRRKECNNSKISLGSSSELFNSCRKGELPVGTNGLVKWDGLCIKDKDNVFRPKSTDDKWMSVLDYHFSLVIHYRYLVGGWKKAPRAYDYNNPIRSECYKMLEYYNQFKNILDWENITACYKSFKGGETIVSRDGSAGTVEVKSESSRCELDSGGVVQIIERVLEKARVREFSSQIFRMISNGSLTEGDTIIDLFYNIQYELYTISNNEIELIDEKGIGFSKNMKKKEFKIPNLLGLKFKEQFKIENKDRRLYTLGGIVKNSFFVPVVENLKRKGGRITENNPKMMYDIKIPEDLISKLSSIDSVYSNSRLWRSMFGGKDDEKTVKSVAENLLGCTTGDNHIYLLTKAWTYYFACLASMGYESEPVIKRTVTTPYYCWRNLGDGGTLSVSSDQVVIRIKGDDVTELNFWRVVGTPGLQPIQYVVEKEFGSRDYKVESQYASIYSKTVFEHNHKWIVVGDAITANFDGMAQWVTDPRRIKYFILTYCRVHSILEQALDAYNLAALLPFGISTIRSLPSPIHSMDLFEGISELRSDDPINVRYTNKINKLSELNPMRILMSNYISWKLIEESQIMFVESLICDRLDESVEVSDLNFLLQLASLNKLEFQQFVFGLPNLLTGLEYDYLIHTNFDMMYIDRLSDVNYLKKIETPYFVKNLMKVKAKFSTTGLLFNGVKFSRNDTLQRKMLIDEVYFSKQTGLFTKDDDMLRKNIFPKNDTVKFDLTYPRQKIDLIRLLEGSTVALGFNNLELVNKVTKKMKSQISHESLRFKLRGLLQGIITTPINNNDLQTEQLAEVSDNDSDLEENDRETEEYIDPDEYENDIRDFFLANLKSMNKDEVNTLLDEYSKFDWDEVDCGGDGDCGPLVLSYLIKNRLGIDVSPEVLRGKVSESLNYKNKGKNYWWREFDLIKGAELYGLGVGFVLSGKDEINLISLKDKNIVIKNIDNKHYRAMIPKLGIEKVIADVPKLIGGDSSYLKAVCNNIVDIRDTNCKLSQYYSISDGKFDSKRVSLILTDLGYRPDDLDIINKNYTQRSDFVQDITKRCCAEDLKCLKCKIDCCPTCLVAPSCHDGFIGSRDCMTELSLMKVYGNGGNRDCYHQKYIYYGLKSCSQNCGYQENSLIEQLWMKSSRFASKKRRNKRLRWLKMRYKELSSRVIRQNVLLNVPAVKMKEFSQVGVLVAKKVGINYINYCQKEKEVSVGMKRKK